MVGSLLNEGKILVSAAAMYELLNNRKPAEVEAFIAIKQEAAALTIEGCSKLLAVEGKANFSIVVEPHKLETFMKVLKQLSDQPITVQFSDNKIAILYAEF